MLRNKDYGSYKCRWRRRTGNEELPPSLSCIDTALNRVYTFISMQFPINSTGYTAGSFVRHFIRTHECSHSSKKPFMSQKHCFCLTFRPAKIRRVILLFIFYFWIFMPEGQTLNDKTGLKVVSKPQYKFLSGQDESNKKELHTRN